MRIINGFRTYVDRNRNSVLYKMIAPIKSYISENYKKKDGCYFPELNLVYFHSLKCGGTSIHKTLGRKYKYFIINKHKALKLNAFNFTFVRNPYSRAVSSYKFLTPNKIFRQKFGLVENGTFAEYVDKICKIRDRGADSHFMQLSQHHKINGKIDYFNFIGKVEDMEKDFEKLCKILKIEPLKVGHENKTKHLSWEKYYTPILKKKVYERYENDFRAFGYKK